MEFMSGQLHKPQDAAQMQLRDGAATGDRAGAMSATNGCAWSDLTERGSTLVEA